MHFVWVILGNINVLLKKVAILLQIKLQFNQIRIKSNVILCIFVVVKFALKCNFFKIRQESLVIIISDLTSRRVLHKSKLAKILNYYDSNRI